MYAEQHPLLTCPLPGPCCAAVEKKTKLASPNFLVSRTRLSVRNIPPTWTEKQLKQLFVDSVRGGGISMGGGRQLLFWAGPRVSGVGAALTAATEGEDMTILYILTCVCAAHSLLRR